MPVAEVKEETMCETPHSRRRIALYQVALLESDSADNSALVCRPCAILWLDSLTPGEAWIIEAVAQ